MSKFTIEHGELSAGLRALVTTLRVVSRPHGGIALRHDDERRRESTWVHRVRHLWPRADRASPTVPPGCITMSSDSKPGSLDGSRCQVCRRFRARPSRHRGGPHYGRWLDAFNSGDSTRMYEFVERYKDPNGRPIANVREQTCGFDFVAIEIVSRVASTLWSRERRPRRSRWDFARRPTLPVADRELHVFSIRLA